MILELEFILHAYINYVKSVLHEDTNAIKVLTN